MKREIISHFKEKPRTKTAWWAMRLGLSTILVVPILVIFAAVFRPIIEKASGEIAGAAAGLTTILFSFVLSVAALVAGIRAYRKGERSWVLWIGFVPAILVGAFWVFVIIGEIMFTH